MVYTVDGVNYTRRTKIPVTGAGSGAQTYYQIKLAAIWSSVMQAGFGDARFTKADMQTLIDAWLESKVDSTSANIWVEFLTTPADGVTKTEAYMYFGNAGASSDWDIAATFPDLSDDFEDNDVTDWSGSTAAIESTIVKTGTYSGKMTGSAGPYKSGASKTTDYYIEFDFRYVSGGDVFLSVGKDGVYTDNCVFLRVDESTDILSYYDGSYNNIMSGVAHGVWYKFIIAVHFNTNTFDIWVDGTTRGSGLGTRGTISEHNDIGPVPNNRTEYFDNIFSRKYAANPPTAAFGTEEHQRRTPMMM